MRKRNVKRVKRENGKLRNKLKEVEILQDNNDELIKHIQELESIVDKVWLIPYDVIKWRNDDVMMTSRC